MAIVAWIVAPVNGCSPVSISYSMQPSAKRSLRPSIVSPAACSGLMYAGVPTVTPTCVSSLGALRRRREHRLADPEVRDERVPFVQQDVLGLDVAVHDAVAVRVVERVGHLAGDAHRVVDRELACLRRGGRGASAPRTLGMTKYSRPPASPESKSGRMCGWVSRGGEVDLAEEPLAAERLGEVLAQDLDGDVAVVLEVAREVDGRHAAGAELALDAVVGGERRRQVRHGHAGRWRRGEGGGRATEGVGSTIFAASRWFVLLYPNSSPGTKFRPFSRVMTAVASASVSALILEPSVCEDDQLEDQHGEGSTRHVDAYLGRRVLLPGHSHEQRGTGWVTEEDPAELAARKVKEGRFDPPLDIVDEAARIVDPIMSGINTGEHLGSRSRTGRSCRLHSVGKYQHIQVRSFRHLFGIGKGAIMGTKTGIEWTDATWNPMTGCSQISSGCDHCYALTVAQTKTRDVYLRRLPVRDTPANRANPFAPRFWDDRLRVPFSWRKPQRVFVNSMSDVFHAHFSLEQIRRVFEVMNALPQHQFQVLTKRPERAVRLATRLNWTPNIWFGTSVEDMRVAKRVDALREIPATVRFLSAEPLLGPLDRLSLENIHWVIGGGESGIGARACEAAWARGLRDLCQESSVAFFWKQWGGRTPKSGGRLLDGAEWSQYPVELDQLAHV